MATLKSKLKTIMAELEIDQRARSITDVLTEACESLGIESAGLNPGQMADRCMRAICPTDDTSDVQSAWSDPSSSWVLAEEEVMTDVATSDAVHTLAGSVLDVNFLLTSMESAVSSVPGSPNPATVKDPGTTSGAIAPNTQGAQGTTATGEFELPSCDSDLGLEAAANVEDPGGTWGATVSNTSQEHGTTATTEFELPPCDSELGLKLHKVADLIAASDESVRQVVGRKVVALLGDTGTGKSTFIYLVAGRRLRKDLQRGYIAEEPLDGFVISRAQSSETTTLRPFVRSDGDVVYLDTPGYEDTRGTEIDIATSIAFRRVADCCESLRFDVLVSAVILKTLRGELVRRLLKMVTTFVKDFLANRCAFTFLFTQTNELTQMQGKDLAGIKVELKKLLMDIRSSMGRGSVEQILGWMVQCLEEGLPFVDVFHPELSDRKHLLDCSEMFGMGVHGPTAIGGPGKRASSAVRIGLTQSMKMKIQHQLDNAMEQLGCAVVAEQLHEASRVCDTLRFLGENIDLPMVRERFSEASQILDQREQSIRTEVNMLIRDGTQKGDWDAVKARRALDLVDTLDELSALDLERNKSSAALTVRAFLQAELWKLVAKLRTLNREASKEPPVERAQDWLTMLSSWAAGASAREREVASEGTLGREVNLFKDLVEEGVAQVNVFISRIVAEVEAKLGDDQVLELFHSQAVLDRVRKGARKWQLLGVTVDGIEETCEAAVVRLEAVLSELSRAAIPSFCAEGDFGKEPYSDQETEQTSASHRTCATQFETLVAVVGHVNQPRLVEAVVQARRRVEDGFRGLLERRRLVIGKLVGNLTGPSTCEDLATSGATLRVHVEGMLQVLGESQRSQGCSALYADACQQIADALRVRCSQLSMLCGRLQTTGLGDPSEHATCFAALSACSWIDDHLARLERECFAGDSLTCFQAQYVKHIHEVHGRVLDALSRYLSKPSERTEAHGTLKKSLSEVERARELGGTLGVPPSNEVLAWVQQWCDERLTLWSARPQTEGDDLGTRLLGLPVDLVNETLEVIDGLRSLELEQAFASATGCVHEALMSELQYLVILIQDHWTQHVETNRGHFSRTRDVLQVLMDWDTGSMRYVLKEFPSIMQLRVAAQNQLIAEGARVRHVISTSEGTVAIEQATSEYETFEGARVLNALTWHQADRELSSLKQMLDMRRNDLDKSFQDQVAAFNFVGVQERLEELEASSVPNREARLSIMLGCVVDSVKSKLLFAESELAAASIVTQNIVQLRKASVDVGPILKRHGLLDLKTVTEKLERRVVEHFNKLLREFRFALNSHDFLAIASRRVVVMAYCKGAQEMEPVSGWRDAVRVCERNITESDRAFEKPAELISAFVQDLLTDARSDASEIIATLDKMQLAMDAQHQLLVPKFSEATRGFAQKLLQCHEEVQASVRNLHNHSLAIEVYRCLSDAMEQGLRRHLPNLTLDFASELRKVQMLSENFEQMLRNDLKSREGIVRTWSETLNTYKRKGFAGFNLLGYSSEQLQNQSAYKRLKSFLRAELTQMQIQALAALPIHKYRCAAKRADAVCHSFRVLSGHLSQGDGTIMRELLGRLQNHCECMCQELNVALAQQNMDTFGRCFARYFNWSQNMRTLCDVRPDVASIASMVKKMLEALEKHLTDFAFREVRDDLVKLRQLGRIMTGPVALCCECEPLVFEELNALRILHFETAGEELSKLGKMYALLEVSPSASNEDLRHAVRQKSAEYDADGVCDMLQRFVDAEQFLLSQPKDLYGQQLATLFNTKLLQIPVKINQVVSAHLQIRDHGKLRDMMVAVEDLQLVQDLVPALHTEEVRTEVHSVVKAHARDLENEISACWSSRHEDASALKKLGDGFVASEDLNAKFSAYPDIYSGEFLSRMSQRIQDDIEIMTEQARRLFSDEEDEAQYNMRDFAWRLILLGRVFDAVPRFKELVRMKINILLHTFLEMPWGFMFLFNLGMILEQGEWYQDDQMQDLSRKNEDERIGKLLVSDFKFFRDVLTVVWNKQTVATQKNPSSTVSGIVGKSVTVGSGRQGGVNHVTEVVNGPTLLAGYEAFEREFDRSFAAWYSGGLTLETLAERVVDLASSLTPCEVGRWTQAVRNALPVLLGQIFAYFTISRSGQSYKHVVGDAQDESDLAEGVLLKAHNIQILTILRLLGYDSCATETDLASHLMQIRTGEGKSIILGACSALLALLGFRVRCVCYSDFLSQRDYSLFENLFTAFGIAKRVVYSKITKFSEDAVATKGDIRQLILDLIEGRSLDTSSGRPSDPQEVGEEILLVDEVDVFFGEDFHGQTYNLVALLESEEVRSLLVKIWEHRAEAQNTARLFRHIQQTEEYMALLGKFSDWEILVKTQVAVMCRDLRHFEEPPYVYDPITDRVGYVVMDSVCYDVTYGYRTAFAYLLHSTAPTEDFRREALRLRVPCGKFSYTHIRPARIFGVSGTLSALGDYEWRVMSQYGLKRYTLLPSVYGESNFRFLDQTGSNPITIVDSENDCHVAITEEARLHTSQGRAVIVFFKGSAELEKYLATSYKSTLSQWSLLREGQSLSHKAQTIKGAATSGQATFTTAVFGRGTDFVCTDKKVLDAGGVHVVVNFVPTDMSELTQLQGRTARQGKAGTFCMVLSAAELQSVGLEAAVLRRKRPEEQYDDIHAGMRRRCMEGQTQKEEQVQTASERDALSHALFDSLLEADVQLAKQCFYELYCAESLSEPRSGSDPSSPTAGARVHFTGGFLSDHKSGNGISCVYEPDEFGEYVGAGDYPLNIDAFPNSIRHTFDGVAVDAGTRVTIYSQPNFQGEVLWDRVGPAIVVNELWRDDARYNTVLFNVWKEPLHTIFPPTVREWSGTDMHLWKQGSVRIEDGEPIPQNLKETLPEYGRLDNLTY